MKASAIIIVLLLIAAQVLIISLFRDGVSGDSLEDFEGGVSENLPTDGDYSALATGDINGDEKPDIAFGGEDYGGADTQGLYVYAGNGGGSWTASYNGLPSDDSWGGVALGDADGDGKIELYAGNEGWGSHGGSVKGLGAWEYSGGSWSTSGISSPHPTKTVNELKLLNFTKGPGLDIALTTSTSGDGGIRVYYGSGSSPISWTANSAGLPTSGEYTGIDVRDMNDDGLPDIATVSYSNSGLHIFTQNTGGNGWTDCTATLPSNAKSGTMLGVIIGDCNNDGDADVIYAFRDNGMRILLGNGGGSSGGTAFSWTEPSGAFPSSATSGRFSQIRLSDIDKDSDLDLLAPKANSGLRLYLGNGSEDPGDSLAFAEVTGKGLPTSGTFYGSTYLDFDDDGDLDVAGATWGNGVQVYRTSLSSSDEVPVADAGDDFEVLTGEPVTLDGSGSSDIEDGSNLEYHWNVSGANPASVVLSDDTVVDPEFTAPNTPGNYTFTLKVKDSKDQWSDPDDVIVRVINRPPVADAGVDITRTVDSSVTLNGSKSQDPDGSVDHYNWSCTSHGVTLGSPDSPSPSFIPDEVSTYVFTLTVQDDQGEWSPNNDTVNVTVVAKGVNLDPSGDAGQDQRVFLGDTVILEGDGSNDPDGEIVAWEWNCTSHSGITLQDPNSTRPSFQPDSVGVYTWTLRVQDDNGSWSRKDHVNITVEAVPLRPIADAGEDFTAVADSIVFLDGSGSHDPDGFITNYTWICTTHIITLDYPGSPSSPTFAPSEPGLYVFTLWVKDNDGLTSNPAQLNVTITLPIGNSAPMVNLTYPTGGENVDGNVIIRWTTFDPEGDPIEYRIELSRDSGATFEVLQGFVISPTSGEYLWPTDSPSYPNGARYRVRITVRDTNESSRSSFAVSGDFTVYNLPDDGENGTGDGEGEGFIPGFDLITGIYAIGIGSSMILKRYKAKVTSPK